MPCGEMKDVIPEEENFMNYISFILVYWMPSRCSRCRPTRNSANVRVTLRLTWVIRPHIQGLLPSGRNLKS
jgi:hypothetical protein